MTRGLVFLKINIKQQGKCKLKCLISLMPPNRFFQAKSNFLIHRVVWGTPGHPCPFKLLLSCNDLSHVLMWIM